MNLEDVHYDRTLFTFLQCLPKTLETGSNKPLLSEQFFYERDSACLPCLQLRYLINQFQQAVAE